MGSRLYAKSLMLAMLGVQLLKYVCTNTSAGVTTCRTAAGQTTRVHVQHYCRVTAFKIALIQFSSVILLTQQMRMLKHEAAKTTVSPAQFVDAARLPAALLATKLDQWTKQGG